MATTIYNLQNDAARRKKVSSTEWNRITDTLEFVAVEMAEYVGPGFLLATDFNVSSTGTSKTASVSTGRAIIGVSGERKLVHADDIQAVLCTGTDGSPQTNYCYIQQDGTAVVVQNQVDAPANSYLAWSALCNDSGLSSKNSFPAGRSNILNLLAVKVTSSDRQGGYLQDKIESGAGLALTVTGSGADEKLHIALDPATLLDYKVKSGANDLTAGYLSDELAAGTGISIALTGSDGTNKHVTITNSAPDDKKILTSALDSVVGYTFDKLQAGDNVTITEVSDGGSGKLIRIECDGGGSGSDIKVKADATDTVSDYLLNKLSAGDGVSLALVDSGGGDNVVEITCTLLGQAQIAADDASAGYLEDKFVSGTNVTLTVVTDGDGNKQIEISADGAADSDELVKITALDTTAGYLIDKLAAGSGITITEVTALDGSKTASIAATGGSTDELLKVEEDDSTANYLAAKVVAGNGIAVAVVNTGGVKTLRISSTVADPMPVANGGTGATTASGARTNLGLAIGTDVQAYDAELLALAGLVSAADKLPYFTGSQTASLATFTTFARLITALVDASAARTLWGLIIGTDIMAWDVELNAISGLTSAADKGIHFTGLGTAATHDETTFARTLLDDADAATARGTLGAAAATAALDNQTGTTYTLDATDNNKVVTLNNASSITLTVPTGLGAGFNCLIYQKGAGQVTVSPAGGVTMHSRPSWTKTAGQYAVISLVAVASNEFVLAGDGAT